MRRVEVKEGSLTEWSLVVDEQSCACSNGGWQQSVCGMYCLGMMVFSQVVDLY
jgi:hypothetical protein